jgi:hypothetical protein
MQLHVARLCLDCQEVHDERACPRCSSESFALLSKWVPPSERRARSRPSVDPPDVEAYRQLLASDTRESDSRRWVKRGALLAAVGLGGWLWRRNFGNQAAKGDHVAKPVPTPKPGGSR